MSGPVPRDRPSFPAEFLAQADAWPAPGRRPPTSGSGPDSSSCRTTGRPSPMSRPAGPSTSTPTRPPLAAPVGGRAVHPGRPSRPGAQARLFPPRPGHRHGPRLRAGRPDGQPAEPAIADRPGPRRHGRPGQADQPHDGRAAPRRGRHQALAVRALDLPPRPRLLRQGRRACSTCTQGSGRASGSTRSTASSARREDQHPGPRSAATPTLPARARPPTPVEHEYERGGALQYLAAWDVQEGLVMGRCEAKTGIEPFGRLVAAGDGAGPSTARRRRVFWVVDNGSSHRGEASVRRMPAAYPQRHPGAHAGACQLAQPGGDLLLAGATEGPHARTTSPDLRRSSCGSGCTRN